MDGILDNALSVSENINPGNVLVTILIVLVITVVLIGLCGGLFAALVKWICKALDKKTQ